MTELFDSDRVAEGYAACRPRFHGDVLRTLARRTSLPAIGRSLDVGCGTGLVGEYLNILGYTDLDGLDLSEGMLKAARSKGLYRNLYQMKIGDPLDLPTDGYGVVITTGTFTVGHVGPEGYAELFRIVRPGGLIIHSNRMDKEPETGFLAHHEKTEADGRWTRIDEIPPFACMPLGEPDVSHTIFVHRVC